MEYRKLGTADIEVSVMALGCWPFAGGVVWGEQDEGESIATVHAALDAGINFFDTAEGYEEGHSERVLGRGLAGQRQQAVIASKVSPNHLTPEGIAAACEQSLENLQTDYIDLYQIHRPRPETAIDETLRALDDLIRAGKVRYIGTSTFAAWQFVESLWVSEKYGLNRFICEQMPYNLLDRRVERELITMAQTYGVATIPWGPLAGGMLTGKYKRGQEAPAGSRGDESSWLDDPDDELWDRIEEFEREADGASLTPTQYAVKWLLDRSGVTSVIVGCKRPDQLEPFVDAFA